MIDAERFARHGPISVSPDRTHLRHADGTGFLFLADTAWNGALLSSDADWDCYLDTRAAQGFTAIQFITHAPWTAALTDAEGRTALGRSGTPDERFFDRIDRRLAAVNARGMLGVPVLAWAANFGRSRRLNIGHTASADQLIGFIGYQVERFSRHHVMWVLAGDGFYGCLRARKWKRVGRACFPAGATRAPVTLHPAGGAWPYGAFAREPWLDVYGYQSSHSEDPRTLRWLQSGPPAAFWREYPRPAINLEPVYEGIAPVPGRPAFSATAVRCAIWWSLLNAPIAGVSYGAHGVWSWQERAGEPLNHEGLGIAQPWREAIDFPGAGAMTRAARILGTIDWHRLRPVPELVAQNEAEPAHHISAAVSDDRDLAVLFFPAGSRAVSGPDEIGDLRWTWHDPRTGESHNAAGITTLIPPDSQDWVLIGRRWAARQNVFPLVGASASDAIRQRPRERSGV